MSEEQWLNYYLSMVSGTVDAPLALAIFASISLLPWSRIPRPVRQDLNAIYLTVFLFAMMAYGLDPAPAALASRITGDFLAIFGCWFCIFRWQDAECKPSAIVFTVLIFVTIIRINWNLYTIDCDRFGISVFDLLYEAIIRIFTQFFS